MQKQVFWLVAAAIAVQLSVAVFAVVECSLDDKYQCYQGKVQETFLVVFGQVMALYAAEAHNKHKR